MPNGNIAIFFLILLEYACFPISSEIVLPLSGALAAGNNTPFIILLLFSTLAGVIGITITYALGLYGGSPLLDKLMARFPKTQKPILSSYRFFGNHGRAAVCLGRVIPICRTYISFVAGAAKEPYSSFLIFSSIGIITWNALLLSIGYYFYNYRNKVFEYYERYKLFVLIAAGVMITFFLLRYLTKPKDETAQ